MSHLPGKFVWFEHLSNDVAKARRFYEKLFDWHTEVMPMPGGEPYAMIQNGGAAIGGYSKAPAGAPSGWLSYLSVDDVDASYKAALGAGAKSLMAPRPSPTRPAPSCPCGRAPRAIRKTSPRAPSAAGTGTS
jgi:predicted enzyme related to lactoylglutathione lyase